MMHWGIFFQSWLRWVRWALTLDIYIKTSRLVQWCICSVRYICNNPCYVMYHLLISWFMLPNITMENICHPSVSTGIILVTFQVFGSKTH
jgi:hypothetical protein